MNLEYVKNNWKKYNIKKHQVVEILRRNNSKREDKQINQNLRKSSLTAASSTSVQQSEANNLYPVDAPLFGGDSVKLANGQTIREIIFPLYKKAKPSDLLKIGILCLDDPIYNEYPYSLISQKYKQQLDQLVQSSDISEAITQRINEAKQIMNIKEANRMLKSWYQQDDLFSFNFELSMQNLIRKLVERIELLANKDRRNCSKTLDEKLARAMIPDITVTNLKYNIEFLIVENGKLQSIDDKKKELNDAFKSCTLLHDMLRKIHNGITFYDTQSVKVFEEFKVFAIIISVGKELYVFQKIAECSLPTRVQNCDILNKVILTLVKLRILSDKNFVTYDSLHRQSRSTPPPQHIKLTKGGIMEIMFLECRCKIISEKRQYVREFYLQNLQRKRSNISELERQYRRVLERLAEGYKLFVISLFGAIITIIIGVTLWWGKERIIGKVESIATSRFMSLSRITSLILSLILSTGKCILNKSFKKDNIQIMEISDEMLNGSFSSTI
ncbi:hypothetical protein C2G38_2238936 [Gigaspora rosea]|uniref:Uncharacterized protein n=1 Tax=Gigaspora rosea TaxID=44941 RepID=A0A397W584_9GLOM|nr:hypothetical protein C2G38_2238936 [Gigaspora rosea]